MACVEAPFTVQAIKTYEVRPSFWITLYLSEFTCVQTHFSRSKCSPWLNFIKKTVTCPRISAKTIQYEISWKSVEWLSTHTFPDRPVTTGDESLRNHQSSSITRKGFIAANSQQTVQHEMLAITCSDKTLRKWRIVQQQYNLKFQKEGRSNATPTACGGSWHQKEGGPSGVRYDVRSRGTQTLRASWSTVCVTNCQFPV